MNAIKSLGRERSNAEALGPDALDWQNLFRPSKILDKIWLCQIFNLSSVGALIHSKISVNHKFQSHGNKRHRLLAVRRKGYMRSQESSLTASIEYVASAYYCLCFSSFFLSSNSFNSSRSSCYFYYMAFNVRQNSTFEFCLYFCHSML